MGWTKRSNVPAGLTVWVNDETGEVSQTEPVSVTTSDGQVRNEDAGGGTGIFSGGSGGAPVAKPPTDASGAYSQDTAASRALLSQLLGQYTNYQGQATPTAGYSQAAPLATSQGATADAATWAPVVTSQGSQIAAPASVAPMSFGGPMSAGAQSSGQAQQAQAALSQLVNIDRADSDQVRARQLALADALTGAMNGQGPSVAQGQLQMGLDQALQQQAAIAASSRGQNVGLGQYNAAALGGALSAQANQQAAILRAQEIAQARAQLGDVLAGTRTQDIGLATNQAGLANASNQFNAGQKNNVGMFNADQQNQNQRLDAQLGTQASIANMTSGNQYNAQMNALAQALAIQNGQWQQDTSLANANLGQQNNQFNAGQSNAYNQALALALQQNNQFNAGQAQANNQFNTGQANTYGMNQAQLNQGVNLANLGAALSTNQLNQQGQNNILAALLTGNGQLLGADTSIYGTQTNAATQQSIAQMQADLQKYLAQQQIDNANDFHWKDLLNAGTSLGGAAIGAYGPKK